jgi:SAM-dependent methyltransferase
MSDKKSKDLEEMGSWQNDPGWLKSRTSFDGIADLYDQYRPGYPPVLVEFVVEKSTLPQNGQILEIGCGTGIATQLFAARGYNLLCVEPGVKLVGLAQRKLAGNPRVAFEISTFEDWPDEGRQFDLVISAQAFHWVRTDVAYAKTARILRPSGSLALIWNMYPEPSGELWDALHHIYADHFPGEKKPEIPFQELAKKRSEEIATCGYFHPPEVGVFPWSKTYDAESYLGLLSTYSDHSSLPLDQRQKLFTAIRELIENHGNQIEKPYIAYAYVAKVRKRG